MAWTLCVFLLLFTIVVQHTASRAPPETATQAVAPGGGIPDPSGLFTLTARYAVFAGQPEAWGGFFPGIGAEERKALIAQLRPMAESPADRIRIAIVEGELIGAEAALDRLNSLREELLGEGSAEPPDVAHREELLADIERLRAIYRAGSARAQAGDDADALRDHHGWFGALAGAHGLEADDPARVEAMRPVRRIGFIVIGGVLGAISLGVVGFGLLVGAIVLLATGRLRTRYVALMPGGSVGIETFAIFLAAFWLVQLLAGVIGAGASPGPLVQPLLMWVLAIVPLWPLVRGWSWRELRESLGWHAGRGVLREVGAGLVGYIAGLPVVAFGLVLTFALVQLSSYFSGGAPEPPAHPLPDQLAHGGALQVAVLVSLAVVWAPLVEESIFRGALYDQLRARAPGVVAGLVTGFIFASVHPQGWLAWPALGSIGFVLAMLREWRGSLIASMTAHALNNGIVIALFLLALS